MPGALGRPLAQASSRLARLVPGSGAAGAPSRLDAEEAAAYHEALRQAFRTAAPITPATPPPRPARTGDAEAAAVGEPSPQLLPDGPAGSVPTGQESPVGDAAASDVAERVTHGSAPGDDPAAAAPTAGPGGDEERPAAPPAPRAGEAPGRGTRAPAATAPTGPARPPAPSSTDVMQVPENVASTAEDFFGGLIRRAGPRP